MFCSVIAFLGLIVGAAAIEVNVWYWNAQGTAKYTPTWVHFLALALLIVGAASPILTWPRPVWQRRERPTN
jgi:hypothetical protein